MTAPKRDTRAVFCLRCGDPALGQVSANSTARPFRKAKKGYCAPCVVVRFLSGSDDASIGFALPDGFNPEGLRMPHLQRQFERVLQAGQSELPIEQINWDKVIQKWSQTPPRLGR